MVTKNKMDNPVFEEDISMVNQDDYDDCDDYNASNTSRVDTSFMEPYNTEATSTRLRQDLMRDKINALYRHNVTADLGIADLNLFKLKKDQKEVTVF